MERGSSTFVKQAAILAGASILVRFIGFLYRLPLTDLIGDQGNAYYNAGYQIYTFFFIMSSAGLPAAISKMVAERIALRRFRDAHLIFRSALMIAAVAGVFCGLVVWIGADFFSSTIVGQPLSRPSLIALAPTLTIVGVMAVFRGYFQGMGNTVPTALSQIAEQVVNAFFSVFLAYLLMPKGVEYAAAGGTAGTGLGALAGLAVVGGLYSLASPRLTARAAKAPKLTQTSNSIIKEILKTAFPIILGTAILSYSNMIDTLMITKRLNASGAFTEIEVAQLFGQFSGKYVVLVTLPVSLSAAIVAAVIPSIASSKAMDDREAVRKKINTSLRLSMLLSIPAAIGMSVLGNQIIGLLFPNQSQGGSLLQWGAAGIIFLALAQTSTGALQGLGYTKIPVYGAIVGSIVKIPLNYFLIAIPEINVVGAVLSTIACYFAASCIDMAVLSKKTGIRFDWMGTFLKPLFSSLIMGVVCYIAYYTIFYLTDRNSVSTLASVLFGVGAYALTMILVKGINKDDFRNIPFGRQIIRLLDKARL
ncbi:MAG: polysaccharide biosynthesis protein [Clostridiales bacterium]|jgi:stage V sporulation protein B|nr:polysaccharide biosynthesis protein [Clostridiales bacterium]